MKRRSTYIAAVGSIFFLVAMYFLVGYLPQRFSNAETQLKQFDSLSREEKEDWYHQNIGFSVDSLTSRDSRLMVFVTEPSSTSALQQCYSDADVVYFDEWDLLCQEYYAENDYFRQKNYLKCMEFATTSGAVSYFNPYKMNKPIRYNDPAKCTETFLKSNVWESNCQLPKGGGASSSEKWLAARSKCEGLYK